MFSERVVSESDTNYDKLAVVIYKGVLFDINRSLFVLSLLEA